MSRNLVDILVGNGMWAETAKKIAGELDSDNIANHAAEHAAMGDVSAFLRRGGNLCQQKRIGNSVNVNGGATSCFFHKEAAPGAFAAVRMVIVNHATTDLIVSGTVAAATETAALTNDTTKFHPVKGGSAVDTLDSTADGYGWYSVKWSGAAISVASPLTVPAASSATAPSVSRSDWLPLTYIPRADSGETLPLVMYRVRCNSGSANVSYTALAAPAQTRGTENMGRIFQAHFANDAGDLYASAPQTNSPSGTINDTVCTAYLEYMLLEPAASVWFIGDSTVQCKTIPTDKISNWGLQACALVQDETGIPVGAVNYGYANQAIANYWTAAARTALGTAKPDIAVLQVWGHNDMTSMTTAALARVKVRSNLGLAMDFLDVCRTNGIVPVLCTTFGDSSCPAAAEAVRLELNAAIKAMGVRYVDMSAVLDNTASPARMQAAYDSGDAIHPAIAGIAAQAVAAAAVIKDALLHRAV